MNEEEGLCWYTRAPTWDPWGYILWILSNIPQEYLRMFPVGLTKFSCSWHSLSTDHQELGFQISKAQTCDIWRGLKSRAFKRKMHEKNVKVNP